MNRAIAMERRRLAQEQEDLARRSGQIPPKTSWLNWKFLALIAGGAAICWFLSPTHPAPIPRQDPDPEPDPDAGSPRLGATQIGGGARRDPSG